MIMAVRKVTRELFFSKNLLLRQQVVPRLQLVPPNVDLVRREFSVFNDFSRKIKGETERTKQTTEHVDGLWTEAKAIPKEPSLLSTKWEAFKNKMRSHPVFKRITESITEKLIAADKSGYFMNMDSPGHSKRGFALGEDFDTVMIYEDITQKNPSRTLSSEEFLKEVLDKAYFKDDATKNRFMNYMNNPEISFAEAFGNTAAKTRG